MAEFLSDEWIAAFDELLRGSIPIDRTAAGLRIAHTVTDVPGIGEIEYSIVLGPDGSAVRGGRIPDPTVTFTCDLATAVAINRGDEQTQSVFLDGRLRVGGDTTALLAAREALATLGDVAEPLRRATTYPALAPAESRA
jgi:hypothetical protein